MSELFEPVDQVRWQRLGGEWFLIRQNSKRSVVLGAGEGGLQVNVDGRFVPFHQEHPEMERIAAAWNATREIPLDELRPDLLRQYQRSIDEMRKDLAEAEESTPVCSQEEWEQAQRETEKLGEIGRAVANLLAAKAFAQRTPEEEQVLRQCEQVLRLEYRP